VTSRNVKLLTDVEKPAGFLSQSVTYNFSGKDEDIIYSVCSSSPAIVNKFEIILIISSA
jgi:hypothetical protein